MQNSENSRYECQVAPDMAMTVRKSDFTLTKLDDLFTTQAQREEEKLSKIRDIPLGLIDDFPDHPFKVRDDEDMLQLIESMEAMPQHISLASYGMQEKRDLHYLLLNGRRIEKR
ncbi:hypothetical protein GPK82_08395 [Coprococcus catus]|nr:hypothetical protein [Coprococcus catus]